MKFTPTIPLTQVQKNTVEWKEQEQKKIKQQKQVVENSRNAQKKKTNEQRAHVAFRKCHVTRVRKLGDEREPSGLWLQIWWIEINM